MKCSKGNHALQPANHVQKEKLVPHTIMESTAKRKKSILMDGLIKYHDCLSNLHSSKQEDRERKLD